MNDDLDPARGVVFATVGGLIIWIVLWRIWVWL